MGKNCVWCRICIFKLQTVSRVSKCVNVFSLSISDWKILYLLRDAISKDFDPIVLKPNYGLYRLSQEICDKKYKLMHYEVNLDTTS